MDSAIPMAATADFTAVTDTTQSTKAFQLTQSLCTECRFMVADTAAMVADTVIAISVVSL